MGPGCPSAVVAPGGPAADSADGDDGMSLAVPLGIGAAVLVLGAGVWWFRSRRAGSV
ncbi:hypothetical protein [Streptomyces tailanensis]|uniref:hypothetical protein n=1 Tax=Streptomyces tailanensis TaxID=2569858 RepID=UPI00155A8083|nr:hypothetical protein [Streptomyces tailanensis]